MHFLKHAHPLQNGVCFLLKSFCKILTEQSTHSTALISPFQQEVDRRFKYP